MKQNDKVVCIDNARANCGCFPPLQNGKVYVVEDAVVNPQGILLLKLVGQLSAHVCGYRKDLGYFDARRFRPLDEVKREAKTTTLVSAQKGTSVSLPVPQVSQ